MKARRRELDPARLEAVLRAHDDLLARGAYETGRRRKVRLTRHGDVVVKEPWPRGVLGRLRVWLRRRRWRAGYEGALALERAGVGVARARAHVRRGGRSFTLYEDLSHLARLDEAVRALWAGASRSRRRAFLATVAAWLGDLHARGIDHGDTKAPNVYVEEADGAWRLRFIDTDDVRCLDAPLDEHRRVRSLAQLAASIPVVVTRSDRLRWWRIYARTWPDADARRVAAATAAALAEKQLVVDAPIE